MNKDKIKTKNKESALKANIYRKRNRKNMHQTNHKKRKIEKQRERFKQRTMNRKRNRIKSIKELRQIQRKK